MTKLERLKTVLKEFISDGEPIKLAAIKLSDGSEIEVEGELKKDSKVLLKTESGNIPMKEGSYMTEKGMKFTVDGDGNVQSVGNVQEPEKVEEKLSALEVKLSSIIENANSEIKALTEKVAKMEKDNSAAFVKLSEALTDDPNKGGNGGNDGGSNGEFVQFNKNPKLHNLTLNLKRK
jgi:hypothetical protein